MNIYQITVSSHGRTIEIFAHAHSMKDAINESVQANRNAYRMLTKDSELNTEGEIISIKKLEQLYASSIKATYYA